MSDCACSSHAAHPRRWAAMASSTWPVTCALRRTFGPWGLLDRAKDDRRMMGWESAFCGTTMGWAWARADGRDHKEVLAR